MDLKSLENERLYILKRLGILKLLSIIEALLVGFLVFVFTRDSIICLASAVLVGIFFFRFTSKKLNLAKNELETKALNLFLRCFNAKIKKESLHQKDFEKLELTKKLVDFKSQNCFEFKEFKIYDICFLDENKHFFCGILLEILKSDKNINLGDEEQIYIKLKDKNFTLNHIYSKQNHFLVATLSNPFFIDTKKDMQSNFENLEKNLNSIKEKFLS